MTTSDNKPRRPVPAGFMRGHWSRWLSLGFGSGLSPYAPGTVGTLMAWALFEICRWSVGILPMAVASAVGLIAGSWLCARAASDLEVADHPAIVWDEIVAFWLILLCCHWWFAPLSLQTSLVAFGLFRFFDAVKPGPIGWLDRRVKGGLGIMIDDLAAAVATVIVLFGVVALVGTG